MLNRVGTVKGEKREVWGVGYSMSMIMVGQQNYKFLAEYFYQYFQIFSVFTDKILSIFQNLLVR